MADLRIPASAPPPSAPARPLPPARAEAVRAAQRAFFDTALAGDSQAAAASAPAEPARPVAPVREVRPATDAAASPPSRLLRPGSLLDIKV